MFDIKEPLKRFPKIKNALERHGMLGTLWDAFGDGNGLVRKRETNGVVMG